MTLVAKNLSKTYRAPKPVLVLSEISLSLASGESIAICGRSGEGKTTLLHILGSLEAADSGSLEIEGKLLTRATSSEIRSRSIGFVFQSFNLLEDFTALENVLFPAKILRRSVSREDGLALLESVGLADRADFHVKLLSGGEKQRVAIARALCNDPSLILADEPTGNLDEANAMAVGDLLLSLVKKRKKSLILATHDIRLALLCEKTYRLSGGKLEDRILKGHIL
jgi:lipoprotein-releasing system ATP-binding protein